MADFDPQAYLAQKTAAIQAAAQPSPQPSDGFDPAAYMAKKQAAIQQSASPQRMSADSLAKPGVLESLGRGAEQGVTMGFGDELNGALEAAKNKLADNSDEDFSDLYTKHRDESRALMKAAEKEHPIASGIGNIAGAALPALATAGTSLAPEAGLAGAVKLGAATGAISGLGNSEATDATGLASDALKGGAVGGLLGGAVQGVGAGLKSTFGPAVSNAGQAIKESPLTNLSDVGSIPSITGAFKQGLQGRKLYGESGAQAVNDEFGKTLENATNTVQGELNKASSSKAASLNAEPDQVDITDWIRGVTTGLKNAKQNNPFASDHADLNKVLNVVGDFVNGNEDSNITGKGLQVDPRDLEMLKRKLGSMGSEGDSPLNTSVGKQFVNRIMTGIGERDPNLVEQSFGLPEDFTPLKDTLNNHVAGLDETNQRIHQLRTALDMIPNKSTVANAQNANTSGFAASDKMQDFLGALPDDVRNQIAPGLNNIGKAASISGKLQSSGLAPGFLSQNASGEPYAWANAAGLAANTVSNVAKGVVKGLGQGSLGTAAGTLRNMAPEELGTLATKLKAGADDVGQKLGSVLEQASQRDQMGRNAILFTVEQNPLYREALKNITGQPGMPNQQ